MVVYTVLRLSSAFCVDESAPRYTLSCNLHGVVPPGAFRVDGSAPRFILMCNLHDFVARDCFFHLLICNLHDFVVGHGRNGKIL